MCVSTMSTKAVPCVSCDDVRALLTYPFGFERRLYLPVLEAFPVDASEEDVVSDVPLALLTAAQALGWKLGHQLLKTSEKCQKTVKT